MESARRRLVALRLRCLLSPTLLLPFLLLAGATSCAALLVGAASCAADLSVSLRLLDLRAADRWRDRVDWFFISVLSRDEDFFAREDFGFDISITSLFDGVFFNDSPFLLSRLRDDRCLDRVDASTELTVLPLWLSRLLSKRPAAADHPRTACARIS